MRRVICASSQHGLVEGHRAITNSLIHKVRLSLVRAEYNCTVVIEATDFSTSDSLGIAPDSLDYSGRHLLEIVVQAILGPPSSLGTDLLAQFLTHYVTAEIAKIIIAGSIGRRCFLKCLNQKVV